jgi:hypothetical protein
MASERQRRANRKNARRSTGPRTAAGKGNAAQNSFRHGLAADIRNNSTWNIDIENLAQHYYCEGVSERHRFVHARTAAEAQFAINRVRQARVALIEHAVVDHGTRERLLENALKTDGVVAIARHDSSVTSTENDEQTLSAIYRVAEKLLQFDRYERRAVSRRKKALRALFRQ